MEKLNYQFLLSLCIVLAGFGFRRSGILSRADGEALSRLVLNITLPALILDTFSSFTMDGTLAVLPVVCVAFSVMMSVVSYRVFRNEEPARRGILTISAMGFNIGLFAFRSSRECGNGRTAIHRHVRYGQRAYRVLGAILPVRTFRR